MKEQLSRSIRTPGAVLMGLGSILGTGIFVSIAIATQIAGNGIIPAIVGAAILATLNGLSSAQLAAAFPVSGGTYEYGYRVLGSYWGFTAGWMFMIAKSASAATAVLGCAGYLFFMFDVDTSQTQYVASALFILLIISAIVSGGIKRSNTANKIIVSITLFGLAALVVAGVVKQGIPFEPITESFTDTSFSSVFYGAALMFVAFTGYGRIATLSEEVAEPRQTIPKAIIASMALIVIIYLLVATTALQTMGAKAFGLTAEGEAAPLMVVAQILKIPGLGLIISLAAITAMLGVLLNLILGLSRVLLGMARRNDAPHGLSVISPKNQSPVAAVWTTSLIIAILVLSGDITFTWSFSAFTVLIYYAITNLSAFFLAADQRLYPRWIPFFGFFGCFFLAFWIQPEIHLWGLILLFVGFLWHFIALRRK